jgi:hypothetical protein
VEVRAPAGANVARFTVEDANEKECSFQAPQTGVYTIRCQPGKHTMRMVWCTHPVALGGVRGRFHFIGTAAELCFRVPDGTRELGVRVIGEGEGERVSATLLYPSGKVAWKQDDIGASQSYRAGGAPAAGVWKIRLARPKTGAFEDHYLELRGVVPVVAFHPDALLVP